MIVAAAQIKSGAGTIESNLNQHLHFAAEAAKLSASLLVFPELSLSGYEPQLVDQLAMNPDDSRLSAFQVFSDEHQLSICVGLPLRVKHGVQIAMAIFQPNHALQFYGKQLLHADEKLFFVSGQQQVVFSVNGAQIAPAICYESLQPNHVENLSPDLYLASVAKPASSIGKGRLHYPKIAREKNMYVVCCNAVGPADNFVNAGQSAVWNNEGQLVHQLGDQEEGLLTFSMPNFPPTS